MARATAHDQDSAATKEHATKRAVIYLRSAALKQGEDPSSSPKLVSQEQRCRKQAQELGAEVIQVYTDVATHDRPDRDRLLNDLGGRSVDYVIVERLDRVTRNRRDFADFVFRLRMRRTTLVSAAESADEARMRELLLVLVATIDEINSRSFGQAVVSGMRARAKNGYQAGIVPLGYRNTNHTYRKGYRSRRVSLDSERGPKIRWAFEAMASGQWTVTALARELRRRGLTTRARAGATVRPITAAGLVAILRNPFYRGIVCFGGHSYPGAHEPLVDAELFDLVQDRLASRRGAPAKAIA